MSQTDLNVANGTGAAVRADINDHLSALVTQSAGSTAPGTTFPNQMWFDTTAGVLKRRNNANTAWTIIHVWDQPTKTALESANIPAGVDYLVIGGYATEGDGGGGRYHRVVAEPGHALKAQSGDGAWWELAPGGPWINVKQAGATGDGTTNDGQAFLDAKDFASFGDAADERSTYGVYVPPGHYYLGTTTLELKKQINLLGAGAGFAGPRSARLRWDANVTGIIVHTENTIGATQEGSPTTSGEGSRIEGLELFSDGGTIANITDDTKGHGIWLRGRAELRHLRILDFPGHGAHIFATASVDPASDGNANSWRADTMRINGCHLNGFNVDGNNANAGVAINVDCSANGRWGIRDSSLLSNTLIACHTQGNGQADAGENGGTDSSVVHYNGSENGNEDRRYVANVAATEADLVATTPGTDEAVWTDIGAGTAAAGIIPTWQSGQSEGTYFHGGAYHTDDSNAPNVIQGCYSEPGQGPPQYVLPTAVIGGTGQNVAIGSYVAMDGNNTEGRFRVKGANAVLGADSGKSIVFQKDFANVWAIDSSNHLRPTTDAVSDLGSASQRVRDGYIGRNLRVQGRVREPFVPVPEITANVTALDPGEGAAFKLSSDNAYQIEGVVAGTDGDKITLFQTVGFTLTFVHASGVCAASERIFFTDTANNAIGQHGAIGLKYDGDALVWRGWKL